MFLVGCHVSFLAVALFRFCRRCYFQLPPFFRLQAVEPMDQIEQEMTIGWYNFLRHDARPNERKRDLDDAIDLIDNLLVYDHMKRLTAQEALNHPFLKLGRTKRRKRHET